MKQLEIANISLSDFRITKISLGEDHDRMDIISEGATRISDEAAFETVAEITPEFELLER